MVAGMTPTTVKAGFVSAVLEAGYHVELAGGGHYSQAALCAKVTEIQTKTSPGIGLTLNTIYINPHQFSFQLPCYGLLTVCPTWTTEGGLQHVTGVLRH
jgi:fatty acid synthase subunit alpha